MTKHKEQFQDAILEWSIGNLREFPWRETTDPYKVLVAEILLQRTPAERVEPVYEEVVEAYPNLAAIADAEVAQLAEMLQTLGFQNQRAQALVDIGKEFCSGGIPQDESKLLELPYVGRYAANATLCFAFGQSCPIVDANVVRVYGRAFNMQLDPEAPEAWHFAEQMLPETEVQQYNLALLDFGSAVCSPVTPNCDTCFFESNCEFTE